MTRSVIENFDANIDKEVIKASEVLEQIPAYRARQAENIRGIVAKQGHGSKRLIPVCEALVNLLGIERRAKSRVGEKAGERILAEAEERLAMKE